MITIHISDIHFGRFNPKIQRDILNEQFIAPISTVPFDAIVISGDLFDHKMFAENDAIMYAIQFIQTLHDMCLARGAKLILIKGTPSHDSDQLKMFYHYLGQDTTMEIVEHIGFVEFNGHRILCIPEEHGIPVDDYNKNLFDSGLYDMAVFHGMLKGGCYGADVPAIDTSGAPIFDISHFCHCRGPIIGGHIHTAKCLKSHMYYTGSPYRWCFGEEEAKGFIVCCYNDTTYQYMTHFQPIESFRYDTVNLDEYLEGKDPKFMIEHIKDMMSKGIDYIRVELTKNNEIVGVVKDYFKNNSHVQFKMDDVEYIAAAQKVQQSNDQYAQYNYLLDTGLTPEEKLARLINDKEGLSPDSDIYFTGAEILRILSDV